MIIGANCLLLSGVASFLCPISVNRLLNPNAQETLYLHLKWIKLVRKYTLLSLTKRNQLFGLTQRVNSNIIINIYIVYKAPKKLVDK